MQSDVRQAPAPWPLRLNVDQYWHLKQGGAFSGYLKAELLDGELFGVPLIDGQEPETDLPVPIRLDVDNYARLDAAGLLPNCRTELIDGLIYEISPQHRPHWFAKNELTYRLRRALEGVGSPFYVGSEGSVLLSRFDLAEPDIIITTAPTGPGPIPVASVVLLVEIADNTKAFDLGRKADSYAAAGVEEYWVLDVTGRATVQHWSPGEGSYARRNRLTLGEPCRAATLDDLAIDTTGL